MASSDQEAFDCLDIPFSSALLPQGATEIVGSAMLYGLTEVAA